MSEELKKLILDKVAEGGIEGIDLSETLEELGDEHVGAEGDDYLERLEKAAEDLENDGKIEECYSSFNTRLSPGEFADRILAAVIEAPTLRLPGEQGGSCRDRVIAILKGNAGEEP